MQQRLADGGALERWRGGIAQDAVEPVERPVHLDVHPARRRVDVLPLIVLTPACNDENANTLRIRSKQKEKQEALIQL